MVLMAGANVIHNGLRLVHLIHAQNARRTDFRKIVIITFIVRYVLEEAMTNEN